MRGKLKCSLASTLICIFSVISACKFPEVCINTKQLNCNSEKLCVHGDCYRTTKSLTIDPETVDSIEHCPEGFNKYKEYCFKVDYEKRSWNDASHDLQSGQLVSLLTGEDAKISAEYLRMKLTDSNTSVWTSGRVDMSSSNLSWSGNTALAWHGNNTFSSLFPLQDNTCLALRPNNYTYWDLFNCETELLSLRSADLMTGDDFMCRCEPGYQGQFCDSEFSVYETYELRNPQSIDCANNTEIYIEFALYEYRANSSASTACAAPNTIALLRYFCQGKNNCTLEPAVLKSYFGYACDVLNATLTIQYSCLPRNETTCPSGFMNINQYGSKTCLKTHEKATWNETVEFCETNGGQLAALHDNGLTTFIGFIMDLKNITTFWFFEQQPDLRPNTRRPDVCTKAMIDSKIIPTNFTVIRECSGNFHGLCAFPPFRHDVVHKRSVMIQPTSDDATDGSQIEVNESIPSIIVDTPTSKIPVDTPTIQTNVDVTTTETKMDDRTTEIHVDDPTTEIHVADPAETLTTGEYCPAQSYGGLNWPSIIQGSTVTLNCPPGQHGEANWTCLVNGEYNPIGPDFSGCVTSVTADIHQHSHKLDEGHHPDVVVTDLAMTIKKAETIASGDIVNAVDLLDKALIMQQQIMRNMTNEEKEETMNTFTLGVVNATGAVLTTDRQTSWFGLNTIDRAETATKLLSDVDSTGILHASTLTSAKPTIFEFNEILHLYFEARNITDHFQLELPNIIVPSEAFQIANWPNTKGNIPNVVPIVVATYNTIGLIMPISRHFQNFTNVTQVIGATLNKVVQLVHDKVTVSIKKPNGVTSLHQSVCVFWNESQWSTNGCEMSDETNDTHFLCKCDHMTSFAVLMSFQPHQVDIMALNIITITGCSISILCLAACIITFLIVRSLRTFCYKVHLHLCISLMIADTVLIMAHFYKAYQVEVDKYCTVLAMLLHYFYLATFMWMFLEGVQIYLALVRVFAPVRNRGYVYFLIGYGIPGLVVGISAGVNMEGYASANDCFLDTESGFIWVFIAFVLLTLMFNIVLLFLSLKSASRLKDVRNVKQTESAKQWLWQITILHPLLGLTWFFGLLQFGDQLVFSYIFTILNSLQGTFIFLFHVFRNEDVRRYFARIYFFCGANDAETKRITRTPATSSSGERQDAAREHIVTNRKLGPNWKKDIRMDRITSGHLETDLNEYVILHSAHAIDCNFINT